MSEYKSDNIGQTFAVYTIGEMAEAKRASFWKGFVVGSCFMLFTLLVVGLTMGV